MYILLTETVVFVDFIQCMGRDGLLDTGHYVVISVQEEVLYSVKMAAYESKQYHSLRQHNLRGLLIVTASPPSNPNYATFQEKVIERNRMKPFLVPYHPKIHFHVPIYAGLAYDAVVILANAFHKVIQNGLKIDNGIQVIDALKNFTYESKNQFI